MKIRSWLVAGGVFLVLLAPLPAAAEMCESTGEYEYTYGDNESIMQAKQRCEGLALRAAIEQCALFVSSTTNIENYELRDDLVNTIAAALVKNKKVLAQRVEGRTIYYKVSIKLDDEQMSRAIEAEQARRAPAQPQSQTQPPAAPVEERAQPAVQPDSPVDSTPAPAKAKPSVARPSAPAQSGGDHNLAVQLGQKALKKADWEPVHEQSMFSLHYDTRLATLPVSLSFDLLGSAKKGTVTLWDGFNDYDFDVNGTTSELSGGLRYYFPVGGVPLRPYVGAGLSIVSGTYEMKHDFVGSSKVDGTGVGSMIDAGLLVPLASLFVGIDLRVTNAKVSLKGKDLWDDEIIINAASGGTTFSIALGYHW